MGSHKPPVEFLEPANDPGLFGPDSVCWRVHADFVSMMIGGISSLILQSLHPKVLAGVWDHSNFRTDLKGRLSRTAFFIAATTYGSRQMAQNAIDRVNQIHQKLSGVLPNGESYRVNDPNLLYWVHLTESWSFLNAYQRYVKPGLTPGEEDQYFSEISRIPKALGCIHQDETKKDIVAVTKAEVEDNILAYLPELEFTERTQYVIELLESFPKDSGIPVINQMMIKAGFSNLPTWTYPLMKRETPSKIEREMLNQAIALLAKPVRWALARDGVAAHAKRRVGRDS
jgi:uncharacterized protein (DUF2236 family)